MLTSPRSLPALVVGLFSLVSLAGTPPALAAGPATVTVRVEGLAHTLVPPTQVTTTINPIVKNNSEGHPEGSCPGTSAAGALELATAGNWSGKWYGGEVKEGKFEGLGYAVEMIEGEDYPFTGSYYWDLWLNNKAEENHGVCGAEVNPGDQVLLFPCHFEEGKECPTPLGIEAPATANSGEAVTVTVKQYNSKGEASPAVGANVGGAAAAAVTDSQGHATLTLFGDATDTLRVSGAAEGPPAVRTETTICVHEGNDGTCGTTAASKAPQVQIPASSVVPSPQPVQTLTVDASGVRDGHVYSRRHAPRVLSGAIVSKAAVTSISIRLRRTYRGRCWAYSGARERLQRVRCGRGSFFSVGSGGSSFSYLLPSKLPPGRYVFEIEASDAAGDHSLPQRGTSKIVFRVR